MHTDLQVTGGGPALFRLVRFWSRRWAAGVAPDEGGEVAHILVLEAIDAARGASRDASQGGGHDAPGGTDGGGSGGSDGGGSGGSDGGGRPVQIGAVAVELGLDRSNASRMLAATVAAGLVTKTVSAQDARRTELELTAAGEDLLAAARAWQEQTFARMVADWPARDARRFAAYLARLAASQPKGVS